MIRTIIFPCKLPKEQADSLNRESGRIYTETLIEHYRVYRHTGHWLSSGAGERINDSRSGTFLHAHSRDAAQQGLYKACQSAAASRRAGLEVYYPHQHRTYRTSIWKNTGIRKREETLLLSLAKGHAPISVTLPSNLRLLAPEAFLEMQLLWDRAGRHYFWHLMVENYLEPAEPPGDQVAGVDLGEIHPAAVTDGEEVVVFSAREMRSLAQYTHKRLAEIQAKQARKTKGSRSWKRLQRRKGLFLAQQHRRRRDLEHKVSRAVVKWGVERQVGTLAVGDVRDAADGVALGHTTNQKISSWSHGRLRQYLTYKAQAAGITVVLVDEAYTSQECPNCHERHKPRGRNYLCPVCGFVSHRDAVGSANILSRFLYSELGNVSPPAVIKYRHPFDATGKRSPVDTGQVAWAFTTQETDGF
jgi:putative transposase